MNSPYNKVVSTTPPIHIINHHSQFLQPTNYDQQNKNIYKEKDQSQNFEANKSKIQSGNIN